MRLNCFENELSKPQEEQNAQINMFLQQLKIWSNSVGTKLNQLDTNIVASQQNANIANLALQYPSSYVPTTATSDGTTGQIAVSGNYIYLCIAKNSWIRFTGAAW